MESLSVKIENKGDTTLAGLAGEITEDSDFSALLAAAGKTLVLDLADVKRINSTGVREWINFVSALGKNGRKLVLERCSTPIVQQLNMISNFRGNSTIKSVYAPYYCAECDEPHARLIDLSAPLPDLDAPFACPSCGTDMEFDDLPDSYLSFHEG
jgi:anti-anti-sigma regulatory factor